MVTINKKVQSLHLEKRLVVIIDILALILESREIRLFLAPCHFRSMDLFTHVLLISTYRSAISSTRTLPLASRSSTLRPMPRSLEKPLTTTGISRFTMFSSPRFP